MSRLSIIIPDLITTEAAAIWNTNFIKAGTPLTSSTKHIIPIKNAPIVKPYIFLT